MTLYGETVNKENRYWWLEDRIDSEERRARVLKHGLLSFLHDLNKSCNVGTQDDSGNVNDQTVRSANEQGHR